MSNVAQPMMDAPPTYAPEHPQILVAPLPDAASFFRGRTIQGEVFVKGLGEKRGNRGVKRLSARLELSDSLPGHPTVSLHDFTPTTLYPPYNPNNESSSAPPAYTDLPFSSTHRFTFVLPPSLGPESPIPGTLNLSASRRGEIKYTLTISLTLSSGGTVEEVVPIDGTPQDVSVAGDDGLESKEESEAVLERDGVKTRFVMESDSPRLGDLVRLGVEVKPMERRKTGVAGLSAQPNPTETLRPLRRVRVELFRRVKILDPSISSSSSTSGTSGVESTSPEHLSLMWSSGKSLRFPGTSRARPPLRVLFTLPTAQLGSMASETYGEITSLTSYHHTTFLIRVTIGFGSNTDPSLSNNVGSSSTPGGSGSGTVGSSNNEARDWFIERDLTIRPRLWIEPREVIIQGGHLPASGMGVDVSEDDLEGLDEATKAAYRTKGLDIVGSQGTYRAPESGSGVNGDTDAPPSAGPGPSGIHHIDSQDTIPPTSHPDHLDQGIEGEGALPSFSESQAQMQAGDAPVLANGIPSERLAPVQFDEDRTTSIGRRGSLSGELGQWVEYDGYETFSVAPPSAAVSYGLGSSMDPPQEGDDDVNVVGGMVARLGLGEAGGVGVRPGAQAELMEQLGLGEGTRVVDLQDDLPPGIDEPSLPGLPGFDTPHYSPPPSHSTDPPSHSHPQHPHSHPHAHNAHGGSTEIPSPTPPDVDHDNPPSFAASEAAQAVGGVALAQPALRQRAASVQRPLGAPLAQIQAHPQLQSCPAQSEGGAIEAPPGYFGAAGGLPPYSQG